jgi:hypothetical protein
MARPKTKKRASKQIKSRKRRFIFGYPLIFFLLLCAGVFLAAWTWRAGADNILVSAKVSAPLVTQPATINSPANGTHFSSIPVAVSGTCPANAAYVEIFSNNVMKGVAQCRANFSYNLSIDLFAGQNSLVAHVFNMTDDEGPVSGTTSVYYNAPVMPGNPAAPASSSPTPQLAVTSKFVYKGFLTNDLVEWPIELNNGVAPYRVDIDWGDNTHTAYNRPAAGAFTISHRYTKQPTTYKNAYLIKVNVTDSVGSHAFLQFFVVITQQVSQGISANIFTKPPPTITKNNWLWFAWPAYLLVLLMVFSYWMGEREELVVLKKRGMLKH